MPNETQEMFMLSIYMEEVGRALKNAADLLERNGLFCSADQWELFEAAVRSAEIDQANAIGWASR